MKWNISISKNNPCYLVIIYYKHLESETVYKHSDEKLNDLLNQLCEDKTVADFVVFKKVDLDPEEIKGEKR